MAADRGQDVRGAAAHRVDGRSWRALHVHGAAARAARVVAARGRPARPRRRADRRALQQRPLEPLPRRQGLDGPPRRRRARARPRSNHRLAFSLGATRRFVPQAAGRASRPSSSTSPTGACSRWRARRSGSTSTGLRSAAASGRSLNPDLLGGSLALCALNRLISRRFGDDLVERVRRRRAPSPPRRGGSRRRGRSSRPRAPSCLA